VDRAVLSITIHTTFEKGFGNIFKPNITYVTSVNVQ